MANKEYPWCPFSCLILVNLRFFKIDIEWRKNHFLQNEKRLLPVIFSKGERDERERASKSKSRSSPFPNVKQKLTLITRGVHMGRSRSKCTPSLLYTTRNLVPLLYIIKSPSFRYGCLFKYL